MIARGSAISRSTPASRESPDPRDVVRPGPRAIDGEGVKRTARTNRPPTIRISGITPAVFCEMKILTIGLCVFDAMLVAYDLHQITSWVSLWI